LAAAQLAIGESSNLAQICLTYTYNFEDQKFDDYVCILSVLAQVAIDNAKRRFDIDLTREIDLIKRDMDIRTNKYPSFWGIVKKGFNKQRVNPDLICPMNYVFDIKTNKYKNANSTLPMSDFFIKHELVEHRRKCKKVEELIQKYSLDLFNYNIDENDDEQYLLLRHDFDKLISDIQTTYISKNYVGLMSWLINRAFSIGAGVRRNDNAIMSTINTNKAILLKTLYTVNPDALLKCFISKEKVDT
jgi:hypothetical protein